MMQEKQANGVTTPTFTREQLMDSKTLGLPRDAVAVVLADGAVYTKEQAASLVQKFLNRRV